MNLRGGHVPGRTSANGTARCPTGGAQGVKDTITTFSLKFRFSLASRLQLLHDSSNGGEELGEVVGRVDDAGTHDGPNSE